MTQTIFEVILRKIIDLSYVNNRFEKSTLLKKIKTRIL